MRLKIRITGLVQGVGFRPFVYRLAKELGLKGYVLNDSHGVTIEADAEKQKLDDFLLKIDRDKPPLSKIYSFQHTFLHVSPLVSLRSGQGGEETGFTDFEIRSSKEAGDKKVFILPDIASCAECVNDIRNKKDRRYMYPFTNCTNCGPRFTIIQTLPYDRKNTTMKTFEMCPECKAEYSSPSDRRFHAQPDACPVCGPHISLYDSKAKLVCKKKEAVDKAVELINSGNIIAVKGIGGFHLVCDATDEQAVSRLRQRKSREEKPMAVMFPDPGAANEQVYVSHLEERALSSIERPIVILKKRPASVIADSVSPDNSTAGVFLPYTPLHHILLQKLKKPVIATSANMTDEPIVKDESDAFNRLPEIADHVLSHNRDIARRCDDSVVRIAAGRQVPIRRSRGFSPLPVSLPFRLKQPVLALGPYMNNTIAVGTEDKVFISQHIGDLDTPLSMDFYEETINDFMRMFEIRPGIVVSDLHPGYHSTKFGEKHFKDRLVKVQHHFAHILSCMAENDLPENAEVIGFAFDGTGYGTDKTIWGGEVLTASYRGFKRAFHLQPYKLPGGEKAVKEPVRTAFSLLYEAFGEKVLDIDIPPLSQKEKLFFMDMIKKNVNSPSTSSMGRLFDGVSSLIGIKHKVSYHAQAAIALEQAALRSDDNSSYPFTIEKDVIDHRPLIEKVVHDMRSGVSAEKIAKKFHNTVLEMIITVSETLRERTGTSTIALSGGVFQNALLIENVFNRLSEKGFTPLIHQLVPSNDGGISLGQAVYGHTAHSILDF